ncbi:5-bromo-4-chloroindolyl phosphate hydrolysis protein [Alkalispirochaeta americana]|uniref:5-bromo-4-chloroindolyl phosphate hydrolysis protein n=1 Tax=Alkalispirochaeta americana TaxID=159291 RepID=A0A1N6SG20_9SPIO|nr:5-bromo-4-chloroindolyl phosphate hydrolysis family protein [Alkalispirochaeta americana]SIQ40000.1 5-bromo-4-chloroindolyl phosphate hydrolysis protein [Alkalispirochaeta americana]
MTKALAAFGAAVVFVVSRHVLSFGLVSTLIVTGFCYTGISALGESWPRRLRDRFPFGSSRISGASRGGRSDHSGEGSPDSSPEDRKLLEALSLGSRKLVQLRRAVAVVEEQRVRAKALAVCDAAARILSEIRQDPQNLQKARKFLDYYLDATITVVERYGGLANRGVRSPEMDSALHRAEASLDTIRIAYEKQLLQLVEDDVMDLDVELRVLEQTIRMEGLGEP